MRIIVYHSGYGCDTGCCGHTVKIVGGRNKFKFSHPMNESESFEDFAKRMVREAFGEVHVKDLDWENCVIVDNCP